VGENILFAFLLTLFAGLSTGVVSLIGGMIVMAINLILFL
jgi:hypothetical protein